MLITIATYDKIYYNQLLALLESIQKKAHVGIKVSLIDYPEEIKELLILKYPYVIFEDKQINKVDNRGIHFVLLRIKLILECFEKYDTSAAWVDTDVIVRDEIHSFIEIEPKQFKILYRGKDKPEKVRFNNGIFNIGCSEESHAFMTEWYDRLSKNMVWGMGQLELYRSYQNHKDKIELINIGNKYNDLGGDDRPEAFAEDSYIWHSKLGHFDNPKFQKEFKKYLRAAKRRLK